MKRRDFDPKKFLATIGEGRTVVAFSQKQAIFSQGDAADAVFYIQQGKVRLTVVSQNGKEATLGILSEGEFFGEVCSIGRGEMTMRTLRSCGLRNRSSQTEVASYRGTLLSDDWESGDDSQPTLARRRAPSQLTQVQQAVNAFPQPEHSAEWKEKAHGWP